ncbi:hypothetical protein [Nocardioides conyzicola]|uniref:Uncharacterized protein n=1 Tax=Nocardioides conyzicola TaxID=1651781 RepID=A0ABP8WLJ4_9ACTN
MTQPHFRLVASLLLVDLAVLVLVLGHFVQLQDTSGFGSDQWNLPLGAAAGVLGVAALLVALPDARARRALGVVLVAGVGVLVVLQATVDGFRFVWAGDELELFAFDVVLVCAGLLLVATGSRRPADETEPALVPPAPPSTWASWRVRALVYLALAVGLVFVAGLVGASYGDAQCTGEGDDCLAAPFWSLVLAFGAFVAMVILITTCELTLRSRRQRLAE